MPKPSEKKHWYLRAGSIAAAVASVGGLAWAVVKAILWVGALSASIQQVAADVAAVKDQVEQLRDDTADANTNLERNARARFRQNEKTTQKIAVALASLQTEVRVRHHEPAYHGAPPPSPVADVAAETNRAMATATMAAERQQTARTF